MIPPRNLLVPTDFSESAEAALDLAVALAGKLDAKVNVLNVVDLASLQFGALGSPLTAEMVDLIVTSNQAALDRIAGARRATGLIGEVVLRTGDPRELIDQVARQLAIDLIVMGTHGRRGVRRLLLGSVAELTVRTAPCPVLTIHPPL